MEKWKNGLEVKGLGVNMVKTKVMVCGNHLNMLKISGCFLCGVFSNGVGYNSIFCESCKSWVHKKCCGISGGLKRDPSIRCARCLGTARPVDGRKITEVQMGNDKLEVVTDFCYLGDMISAGGGCELSSITRCKSASSTSHQSPSFFTTRGQIYNTYIRAVMLYSSETWGLTTPSLNRL